MGWREAVSALLGVSAYAAPPSNLPSLDDPEVENIREALGGQLSALPTTRTRWFLKDLEAAQFAADTGDISRAAQLYRAMRRDAVYSGVLATRTSGLVRLPKRFYGATEIVAELQRRNGTRSVFDEMLPPSELKLLADDGVNLGIGVGELLPVDGRDYPVLVRLDPEWLQYRWNENRWYYLSIAGALPITPGDGRWVLHTPGGRIAPWQQGIWHSCGRAWIDKEHALLHEANWEAKLANPARVATAPLAATDEQSQAWFQQVMAWGVNTVFGMKPGYTVDLLESNGRGYEAFGDTIDRSDRQFMIALAGQVVTTDGGAGFSNADIHKSIRADLIQETGDGLAYTINTQVFPPYVVKGWGLAALEQSVSVEWDTRPPSDLKEEADSYQATAKAIVDLSAALKPYSRTLNIDEITRRGGVPALVTAAGGVAHLGLALADVAKVVKVIEARQGQGLSPLGDKRDALTITELEALSKAAPDTPPPPAPAAANDNAPAVESDAAAPVAGQHEELAPPSDESAAKLAAKMTEHSVDRCAHGATNRCRLCGIERERDFEPSADGAPVWKVLWRPIAKEAA